MDHARFGLFLALGLGAGCATTDSAHAPLRCVRVVLSPGSVEQSLLEGRPQTAGLCAGRVVLAPGARMHRHTTGEHEELLVFLEGQAHVLAGQESFEMHAGEVLYIPPRTEHELENDGPGELRYIYAAAPAGG